MAINDISLTAGMRSNLTTLQSTAALLDRTQNRLSTGKKVNSAIDNPTAFFAAQALNSRASIIDGLKDQMGQAIQTVQAADKGIKAISALIEQAKGIAQQASSAETGGTSFDTVTIDLTSVAAGQFITIGGERFTATSSGTITANEFYVGGSNTSDAEALAAAINADLGGTYSATANGNSVTIADTAGDVDATADVNVAGSAGSTATVNDPSAELASLQAQYNELLNQIDTLAADSGYKGKNLLAGNTLTVDFEGGTLSVIGFDATTGGALALTDATWTTGGNIDTDVDALDAALTTLRTNASSFSGNLSIITVRQDFSTNMVNVLGEGANKLTLADTNEEGANMLMLQTRQSLGTTALSLSAQAAQSVLRLFG